MAITYNLKDAIIEKGKIGRLIDAISKDNRKLAVKISNELLNGDMN